MFRLPFYVIYGLLVFTWCHEETADNQFNAFFKVIEKLIRQNTDLKTQLQDVRRTIEYMNKTRPSLPTHKTNDLISNYVADTYTRWGRSTCPGNATLVYDGIAGGAKYTETGGAANYLCLPNNPDWGHYKLNAKYYGHIYGGEYETHESIFKDLVNNEVPCAVCRVPRSNIIMVPAKNSCYKNYTLEYQGYLMTGYPVHAAASEYVCVDGDPRNTSSSSSMNHDGKLFYFVQAKCGSFKCPPYEEEKEVVCAVCSFSP